MDSTVATRNAQIIDEIESTLAGMSDLMQREDLMLGDVPAMLGGARRNLYMAKVATSGSDLMQRLLKAAYCLGKFHTAMDMLAGDHEGTRCKFPNRRSELRSYREVARELIGKLETLFN